MAEIKNISGMPPPADKPVGKIDDNGIKLPNQQLPQTSPDNTSVGRGNVGQPVGQPQADSITQNELMPGVISGRDPSQLIAAEKLRSNAGHSATDVLLGLDRQPSIMGLLLAPPGNLESLRHMSPTMRRSVLRNLLSKQHEQMRRLIAVLRDEGNNQQQSGSQEESEFEDNLSVNGSETALLPLSPSRVLSQTGTFQNGRAVRELEAMTQMLDMLDELLGMQDYTLSQMGTFAQG